MVVLKKGLTEPHKTFVRAMVNDAITSKEFIKDFKPSLGTVKKTYLITPVTPEGDYIIAYALLLWKSKKKSIYDVLSRGESDLGKKLLHVMKCYAWFAGRDRTNPHPIKNLYTYARKAGDHPGLNCMHIAALHLTPIEFWVFNEMMWDTGIGGGEQYYEHIAATVLKNGHQHHIHNLLYNRKTNKNQFRPLAHKLASEYHQLHHNMHPSTFNSNEYLRTRHAARSVAGGRGSARHRRSIEDLFAGLSITGSHGPSGSGYMFQNHNAPLPRNSNNNRSLYTAPNMANSYSIHNTSLREQHTPSRNLGTLPQAAPKRRRANNNTATSGASGSTRGPPTR